MKKNLALFGILISLLGVTYFFQEKKAERKFEENLIENKLYPGEIRQLTISGVVAKNVNGQWLSGERLLSHNLYKQIEEQVRQIKKVKDVQGEEKDFFASKVELTVNDDKLVIGDLSLDRQGFYVSQNGKIMLAILEGTNHELTEDVQDIQATKLNEFKVVIMKNPKELSETQLFRFYPDLPMERVTIKVPGTLPFELDFVHNTTTPPPFPGITVHEKLPQKFMSLLSQVTLIESIPNGVFGEKLSEITFMKEGKAVMWELFMKNKKTADAVLVDPVRKQAWSMVGGTLKVFFIQLQDYWDKKNIPPFEFKNFDRENMILTEGSLRTVVTLLNQEPLGFESSAYKVNQEKMLELVSYALNLGPLDQARRVSLLSNSEKKQILSEKHLRLEIFGQELLYWVKAEEIIIVNLSQGYKSHFPLADISGGFRFKDVLK
ncbi:MAG: hypothetical protein V4598_19115 [Bdellovibrionota bacterium]